MEDENVKETERVVVRKTTANSTLKTTDLANATGNQGLFWNHPKKSNTKRQVSGDSQIHPRTKKNQAYCSYARKKSSAGEGENARGAEHQPSQVRDENFHFYSGSSTQFTDSPGR